MLFLLHFFLILVTPIIANNYIFPYRNRIGYCKQTENYFGEDNILENPWYLFLMIILGIIFILILLGLIKGLLGICCSRHIGELGLGILIDLPKPLDKYYEKEYQDIPVRYDSAGWPVNPHTMERNVQVLSKKTEFCLNVVFFLAYPLTLILQLCGVCFCVKNTPEEYNEPSCYKSVNMVTMNERIKRKNNYYKCGQNLDIYNDDDKKEEEDTNYVINQMKRSQTSLQNM